MTPTQLSRVPNLDGVDVLIATAGVLPADPVAEMVSRLAGPEGSITVMTVIEVPRLFLETTDDERRFFLNDEPEIGRIDAKANRYLEERGRRLVDPIVAAFRARGWTATARYVEGSDPALAIIQAATEVGAELIVMGATRPLFADSAWGSVSAGVMQRAACPLLLIPGSRSDEPGETSTPQP